MSIDGSYQYYFELADAARVFEAIRRISKPAPTNKHLTIELSNGETVECQFDCSVLVDLSDGGINDNRCKLSSKTSSGPGGSTWKHWIALNIEVACEVEGLGRYFDPSEHQVFRRQSDRARVAFMPVSLDVSCGEKHLNIGFSGTGQIACAMMDDEAYALKSKIEDVYAYGDGVLALRQLESPYQFVDAAVTGECSDYGDVEDGKLDEFVERYRVPRI